MRKPRIASVFVVAPLVSAFLVRSLGLAKVWWTDARGSKIPYQPTVLAYPKATLASRFGGASEPR